MAGDAVRWALPGVLGLALAACTGSSKEPELVANVAPVDYRQEIIDTMIKVLPDPTNVRGAFITDPFLSVPPGGKDQRYIVCVRYNGRDANRQYMGSKDRVGTFFGGHLNQLVEAGNEQCAKAAFKPFPELEKLCQAKACD